MLHRPFIFAVRGLLAVVLLQWAAWGAAYTGFVVIGDSLCDVGNAWFLTNHAYPPPNSGYDGGRFSNGPIWVEDLATTLGVPAPTAFFYGTGGTDIAIGGATTQDMKGQVDVYLQYVAQNVPGGHVDPAALHIVWGGANDFWGALGSNPTMASVTACDNSVATYAANIADIIGTLHTAGAVNFLVPNLPPLGSTPRFNTNPLHAAINSATQDFNADLAADLQAILGAHPDVTIHTMDVYSLFNQVVADPAAYGFTNVTDPAISTAGADPSTFMFWDTIHPTAAGHQVLATAAATVVPEPSALALLAVAAVACLAAAVRRRS